MSFAVAYISTFSENRYKSLYTGSRMVLGQTELGILLSDENQSTDSTGGLIVSQFRLGEWS